MRDAFPDSRMEVEDLITGDDKTVARVRLTGTHRGAFSVIPASGASVDLQLIDIMRFDDAGHVCEHWAASQTCCRSCSSPALWLPVPGA